jgi:type II restriction enzyme
MEYFNKIKELTGKIPAELIDFSQPRDIARTPSQASSNFITNKEQGDWAENLVTRAINETSMNMDTIGKRPDLLIFKRTDFDAKSGLDISRISHDRITEYVKKAIAGIEVRSSSFLIDRYEEAMQTRTEKFTKIAMETKDKILAEYKDVLSLPSRENYMELLAGITAKTLNVADFKVPGWRSGERLIQLNSLFKQLKSAIREIQKRDYLSITPKAEDVKVVYKWIETFNVPHFYFQVFFDKIYGISF